MVSRWFLDKVGNGELYHNLLTHGCFVAFGYLDFQIRCGPSFDEGHEMGGQKFA